MLWLRCCSYRTSTRTRNLLSFFYNDLINCWDIIKDLTNLVTNNPFFFTTAAYSFFWRNRDNNFASRQVFCNLSTAASFVCRNLYNIICFFKNNGPFFIFWRKEGELSRTYIAFPFIAKTMAEQFFDLPL